MGLAAPDDAVSGLWFLWDGKITPQEYVHELNENAISGVLTKTEHGWELVVYGSFSGTQFLDPDKARTHLRAYKTPMIYGVEYSNHHAWSLTIDNDVVSQGWKGSAVSNTLERYYGTLAYTDFINVVDPQTYVHSVDIVMDGVGSWLSSMGGWPRTEINESTFSIFLQRDSVLDCRWQDCTISLYRTITNGRYGDGEIHIRVEYKNTRTMDDAWKDIVVPIHTLLSLLTWLPVRVRAVSYTIAEPKDWNKSFPPSVDVWSAPQSRHIQSRIISDHDPFTTLQEIEASITFDALLNTYMNKWTTEGYEEYFMLLKSAESDMAGSFQETRYIIFAHNVEVLDQLEHGRNKASLRAALETEYMDVCELYGTTASQLIGIRNQYAGHYDMSADRENDALFQAVQDLGSVCRHLFLTLLGFDEQTAAGLVGKTRQ